MRRRRTTPLGRGRRGTWSSPTRPSTSRTPRSSTARALRAIPARGPGRADRHPGGEQPHRAVGDPRLGDPRAARQPQRVPQGVGRRRSSRALEPTKARQFADLVGPFLLRRRKSDPGIAPELPPKTETDHLLGLTREQVVLYEAFVRDIDGAHRARPTRRPAAAWCSRCSPASSRSATTRRTSSSSPTGRLRGPLGEARPARRAARHGPGRGRRGAGLHPVRRDGPAARAPPRRAPASRTSSCTAAPRCASATRWSPASRRARPRSSCSRSRPAAPAST